MWSFGMALSKIAFIGRKQGTEHKKSALFLGGSRLERPRKDEELGLSDSSLEKSDVFSDANYCFIRINPEQVNKRTLSRIKKSESEAEKYCRVINSTDGFIFQSNKTECYREWRVNNVPCPDFLEFSPWKKKSEIIVSVMNYIALYGGVYIRTNNEDSGKGIYYLSGNVTKKHISDIIFKLRVRSLTNRVSNSKILLMQPIKNKDENGVYHVFRAHVVGGRILGGYAIVGGDAVIHSKNVSIDFWSSFLEYNNKLIDILSIDKNRREIVKAFRTTKTDVGAIEFFYVNDELCFLEVNPTWGGRHCFGEHRDSAIMKKIEENIDLPELKFVKNWLSSKSYYTELYNAIDEEFSE